MGLSLFEYGVNKTFSCPSINNPLPLQECSFRSLPNKRVRHTCLGLQDEGDKMTWSVILCSWLGIVQQQSGRCSLRSFYIFSDNLNGCGAPWSIMVASSTLWVFWICKASYKLSGWLVSSNQTRPIAHRRGLKALWRDNIMIPSGHQTAEQLLLGLTARHWER